MLKILKWVLLSIVLAMGASPAKSATLIQIEPDAELTVQFDDRDVVFVARELGDDALHAFNPERINERQVPWSTFKIPNFMIALEAGAIDDPQALVAWDESRYPSQSFWPESWRQAQSLRTAFRRSVVWYFRDLAQAVGGERYRRDLVQLGYGNANAPDGNDRFWLDGSLQISPREQIDFLARLLEREPLFSARHLVLLEEVSLLDQIGTCRLHGKTGSGAVGEDFDGLFEGWLVGWVSCDKRAPIVFALWTQGPSFSVIQQFRQQAAMVLLDRIHAFNPQRTRVDKLLGDPTS